MVITLILWSLVVWRIAYMLHKENGPLDIFARLRAHLAKNQKRMGGLFDMISCFNCVSVWVAIIPAALIAPNILLFLAYTLIMSTIAIGLNKLLR